MKWSFGNVSGGRCDRSLGLFLADQWAFDVAPCRDMLEIVVVLVGVHVHEVADEIGRIGLVAEHMLKDGVFEAFGGVVVVGHW